MKSSEIKAGYCVVPEEELSLSGEAMTGLLQAATGMRIPFRFKAMGFSMSPFIKNGDVVTISPLLDHPIGFGKPVAFIHAQTGRLVIHRVVGKKGDYYLIKGDNSVETDGLIPMKDILGVVSKVERAGRKTQLGFGLERFIIAFLSKTRLLSFIFWIKSLIS